MQRLWFVTNPNSGTADDKKADAIEAACDARNCGFVGRSNFPDDDLPTPDVLDAAKVDTVVLFAGDGTINAAVCALVGWDGAILILPGGTMNLLAKRLHGDAEPGDIVAAALAGGERVDLPYVAAGEHRALVGLIVGPAASWYRAREHVREGSLRQLLPAIRAAWRRTFGRGVRLTGAPGFPQQVQAAYVWAEDDYLEVAAIDARDLRSIAELGWTWVTGDWVTARAVTEIRAEELRIAEPRAVLALFDGEPVSLDPGTRIGVGRTGKQFIATRKDAP